MKRKNTFFAVVMNSKMMTAARTLLTAILLMTGLNGAWADTSVISNGVGGWTKITELPTALGDYYFVFVDNTNDLMLSYGEGNNQSDNVARKTMVYRTSKNPAMNPSMLWEISENVTGGWSIKSAVEPTYYIQTEWNAAWYCRTNDNGGGGADWYNWTIAYADSKWTIQNGKYPEAGYIGPWNDAEFLNGREVAANKTGENIGYFQIYSILRSAIDLTGVTTATSSSPFNYTHKVVNSYAAFNGTAGWTGTDTQTRNGNTGFDGIAGFFEFCNWGAASWSGALSQTVTGLPAGKYRVRVAGQQSANNTTLTLDLNGTSANLPANGATNGTILQSGEETTAGNGVAGWKYTSVEKLITDGTATITLSSTGSATQRWANADNVELYLLNPYATPTTSGTALGARQWYAYTISAAGQYVITSSGMSTLSYTQTGTDGFPDITTTTKRDITSANSVGPISLSAGTLYVFTSAAVTLDVVMVSNEEVKLNGFLKKAKALNTILRDPALTAEIDEAQNKLNNHEYTTSAQIEAEITKLQNLWMLDMDATTPMITINNGTFDNGINIGTDGINTASYIAPATAAKPYIYPVTGWTPNFTFTSTAAQGNTSHYGAEVVNSGNNGTNGTNPPATDMFGQTEGGTLHLSAGWNDQARYKQTVNLPAGRYIFYYEANNQNESAANIIGNYSGVGNLQEGDLPGTTNTWIYSELKHYPYDEWVTSVTEFNLNNVRSGAEMNIGIIGTKGASADAAKLWIDNVELYYLGATISDDKFNSITLPTAQMNQDVRKSIIDAYNKLDDTRSWDDYYAYLAAVDAAATSIAEYERINAYITRLKTSNQLGDIPVADYEASDVWNKYRNGQINDIPDPLCGSYSSLDEVIPLWRTFVANYWKTHTPSTNSDLTAFIVNQGFELDNAAGVNPPTGWTVPWGSYDQRTMIATNMSEYEGNYLYNLWDNTTNMKRLEQPMTGLPKGHYELTAYIAGFGDGSKTKLMGIGGASTETVEVTTSGEFSTQTVTVNAYVTDDAGTLTIRVENTGGTGGHMTFFKADNFKLKYIDSSYTGITLDAPEGQMNASVKEAMLAAEAAHISSPTLANLNARMAAYNTATASIEEYKKIKNYLDKLNTPTQRGSITEGQLKAMTFWTKYSNGEVNGEPDNTTGTYTTLSELLPEYRNNIQAYWTTNAPTANSDLTAFIVNQGLNFGNNDFTAWTLTKNDVGNSSIGGDASNYCYERWNGTFDLSQKLTGLPAGTYTLKVQGFYRPGNKDFNVDTQNPVLYAGKAFTQPLNLIGSDAKADEDAEHGFTYRNEYVDKYIPNSHANASLAFSTGVYENELDILVGADGVTIGAKKAETIADDWTVVDNFRLIFKSSSIVGEFPELTPVEGNLMRKTVYDEQAAAKTAYEGSATPSTYTRYADAIAEAKISHAAYEKAQAAVNRVENLLGHTNVYTYDAYVTFYNIYNTFKAPFDARTLADNLAEQMEYQIFGNGSHHQKGIPVVPFLSSAWDDAGDYTWTDGDYWVNTWSHELDNDNSDVIPPFMEYWHGAELGALPAKTLTAVVKAVPTSLNNVRALIRVLTTNGETPTGLTLQVAPDDNSTPVTNATPSWTRIGDTNYYYTTMRLTGGKADADSDGDGFGDLRIQFVVDATNNFSWLTFKNVWVDYKDNNGNAVTADWTGVTTAVTEGNGKQLGFWGGEFAPYNNVKKLQALEALNAYKAAHDRSEAVNPILVNNALYTYNNNEWKQNPGADWNDAPNADNSNALELNAVSWRTNYTKSEIIPAYDYDGDGNISYTFETIIPDGWELNGRPNAYETRLIKYGVNAKTANGDPGLFANCDSIAVFFKFDTKYGEKLGYTMPLKPNTKYSLTFIYTNWAKDMAESLSFHENNTSIVIRRKNAPYTECPIYNTDDDNNEGNDVRLEYLSHADEGMDMGNADAREWRSVHAWFRTENTGNTGNDEYVIEFHKSINNRQIQLAIGELYILKYRENETLHIDGQSQVTGNTNSPLAGEEGYYEGGYQIDNRLRACNVALTRTLKKGQWNTFCLPVKLPYKDMRRVFQIDGKSVLDNVYIYTGTTRNGIYEVLNFTARRGGIQAGQPVLVKPWDEANNSNVTQDVVLNNEIILRNYVVKNNKPVQKDPNRIYDFVGVYGVYNVQQYDVYTKYNADPSVQKDELVKKVTDDKKTWLQPTRAYFKDVSVESGQYPAPGLVKLWAFSIDDVETGIMAVEPDGTMTVTSGNIYDLNGRLVRQNATSLEGLRPGIYIVDGRKVLVR